MAAFRFRRSAALSMAAAPRAGAKHSAREKTQIGGPSHEKSQTVRLMAAAVFLSQLLPERDRAARGHGAELLAERPAGRLPVCPCACVRNVFPVPAVFPKGKPGAGADSFLVFLPVLCFAARVFPDFRLLLFRLFHGKRRTGAGILERRAARHGGELAASADSAAAAPVPDGIRPLFPFRASEALVSAFRGARVGVCAAFRHRRAAAGLRHGTAVRL